MNKRVVVTGLGICAPNATDLASFGNSMRKGVSGIRKREDLRELGFRCQVAGAPQITSELLNKYFNSIDLKGMNSTGLIYGGIAGMQAWTHAGLSMSQGIDPDWDAGIVFGTSILGVDKFRESIKKIDAGEVRRLGSTTVPQTMASGISAFLAGKLGCGNQVTSNSAACSTGTEAVIMAGERIRNGQAQRMLAGSCSDSGPYIWGGFDAMRIVPSGFNDSPEKASRPLSATASGFVPSSGAGALLLESLESALERNAPIYAEYLGGDVNCGGHRSGGSMTASNNRAVQRCISRSLSDANITPEEIDAINGHLTATTKDAVEVSNWCEALGRYGSDFPFINSFKDVLGHGLAASGSMECVAAILQINAGVLFGNHNAEDLHPEVSGLIDPEKVPTRTITRQSQIIAKASLGFGDVNACVIFKNYKP
ncbi:MAG: beta-ketoacyl synthase N-terminal-like domain-containing protein [Robiginitalea sp.]